MRPENSLERNELTMGISYELEPINNDFCAIELCYCAKKFDPEIILNGKELHV